MKHQVQGHSKREQRTGLNWKLKGLGESLQSNGKYCSPLCAWMQGFCQRIILCKTEQYLIKYIFSIWRSPQKGQVLTQISYNQTY